MAEFVSIDKNKYKIVGKLTEEDIKRINSFKNRTTIILENTAGLSSELVSKLESKRVVFSIKGGIDYDTKTKYKTQDYVDRTFVSPSGLKKIIKYFEYNERMIDPNWNEFEKAMFLYNALVEDMTYVEDLYDGIVLPQGITERSLNGILYSILTCAGFALVYKEMLDRIGIKCYYQNQNHVHDFNIIEVDDKKYGVDVTWDANNKDGNGRCTFKKFGQDSQFYEKFGHQLYKDEDISEDFEKTVLKRFYDTDEEIYDLSLLSADEVKEYFSHIASRVYSRRQFKYNLQEQPVEIKNEYLPIDTVDLKLKQEASQEYPIVMILDFLKKRNALQISPQLIEAFSSRKGYLLDMGNIDRQYSYGIDLSLIEINNYKIDRGGNVSFNNGNESRSSDVWGVNAGNPSMPQEEFNDFCNRLNQYLSQYLNKCISGIVNNLDTLLADYEYKPDEWDDIRALASANIYSKLAIIVNSREYLIQLGMSEQEVDNIIQRITSKYNEIHKPYESTISQKDHDLDFLSAVFEDLNIVWQTIEYDLQKQITEEEFISLYGNVDYMIQLFEKHITIAGDKKFKFDEYDVSKEDLQQLLNKVIQNYQKKQMLNESAEFEETPSSEIHR